MNAPLPASMRLSRQPRSGSPLRASRRAVMRRFLVLFVPLAVAVGGVLAAFLWTQQRTRLALLQTRERHHIDAQSELILGDFREVVSDLMVLSESHALKRFLESGGAEQRAALAREYQVFSDRKRMYDQIRFLDASGRERVRVNLANGGPRIVADEKLQSKAGRYYVKQTLALGQGEVFVSPFDLNVEQGTIEQPEKPTIRFGTPIFDAAGRKRGLVILNYLGTRLIDKLRRRAVGADGRIMLLNQDGYWLHAPDSQDAWGFMYADRRDRSFAHRYPRAWHAIVGRQSGQWVDETGMFTFRTVYPLRAAAADTARAGGMQRPRVSAAAPRGPDPSSGQGGQGGPAIGSGPPDAAYFWKVVSHVPPGTLGALSRQWLVDLARLSSPLAVGLAVGTWFLARYRADHRLADAALRESERRFRQMAENIEDIFWMTRVDRSQFLYVSPSYERIFGRSCRRLLERADDWIDAVHAEDRERVREAFLDLDEQGDFELEYRIVRPDGAVRWIWDRGFAIRDSEGRIEGVTGIAEDTTAMKEARRQVLQSERLAAIGEAMAGLAHESRNALQRSQANLERLAKRVQDRPDALALIERFQAAQRDLHALYEQVRHYAAPLQLKQEPCDLRQLLRETYEQLVSNGRDRPIVLREHGEAVDAVCLVDPFALRQALRNILENAMYDETEQGASRGSVEIDITWSERQRIGQTRLSLVIRDNGPGLNPEEARRIFEPFFTTKSKGTGLGMAITRRIIEAHGGTIAVGEPSGRGAAIHILLPRTSP